MRNKFSESVIHTLLTVVDKMNIDDGEVGCSRDIDSLILKAELVIGDRVRRISRSVGDIFCV